MVLLNYGIWEWIRDAPLWLPLDLGTESFLKKQTNKKQKPWLTYKTKQKNKNKNKQQTNKQKNLDSPDERERKKTYPPDSAYRKKKERGRKTKQLKLPGTKNGMTKTSSPLEVLYGASLKKLTAHNWQKWKSTFLTCPCRKIYKEEAIGL